MKHSLADPLPKRPPYDWEATENDDGLWDVPIGNPERAFWRGVAVGAAVEGVFVLAGFLAIWLLR
jgi:hypothetical protein